MTEPATRDDALERDVRELMAGIGVSPLTLPGESPDTSDRVDKILASWPDERPRAKQAARHLGIAALAVAVLGAVLIVVIPGADNTPPSPHGEAATTPR